MGVETMLLTSLAAGVASGGVQAIGAGKQGQAAGAEAKFNAAQATNEGTLEAQQANQQAETKIRDVRRIQARQRLLIGASGAGTGGTAEDVVADTGAAGELDALTLLYGGQLAKSNALSQAKLYRARGKEAGSAGYLDAFASLLSAGGRAGETYGLAQYGRTRP